jgi:hypothetical protein
MSVVTVPVHLTKTRLSRNVLDYGISWHSNFLKIKPQIKFMYMKQTTRPQIINDNNEQILDNRQTAMFRVRNVNLAN